MPPFVSLEGTSLHLACLCSLEGTILHWPCLPRFPWKVLLCINHASLPWKVLPSLTMPPFLHLPCLPFPGRYYPAFAMLPFFWKVRPCIYHASLSLEGTTLHLPCLPFSGRYNRTLTVPLFSWKVLLFFPGRYYCPAFTMPPFPCRVLPALTMLPFPGRYYYPPFTVLNTVTRRQYLARPTLQTTSSKT